jgi:hypothetical protein
MKRKSQKKIFISFIKVGLMITESITAVHNAVQDRIENIVSENFNAIEEYFEIRKMFKEMYKLENSYPVDQLRKDFPDIYCAILTQEVHECKNLFKKNIEKGIQQDLYVKGVLDKQYISFYYTLIFTINKNKNIDAQLNKLELEALEYHIRAMSTPKGIVELERQINKMGTPF